MNACSARALLGVSPSATTGQITRAYRRLALDAHPDQGGEPTAFRRLAEARRCLLAQVPASGSQPRMPWVVAERPITTLVQSDVVRATRRGSAPKPASVVRFGDVLAEKLAAA